MAEFNATEFNNFTKRLQSALKRRNISVSLSQIKESISELIASYDNQLTEEVQKICLDALIRQYQPSSLVEPEPVLQPVIYKSEEASSDSATDFSAIVQSESLARDLVSSKASSMGIVLSEADVVAIASQLDYQANSSVEDIVTEAEALLIAYADRIMEESKQKVTSMIDRVYSRVQDNNIEVSEHLSNSLQGLKSSLEVSNQDFKRQARQALGCLRISKNSA